MNKTILFDADGTLLDSLWVWNNLTKDYLTSLNIITNEDINKQLWKLSFLDGVKLLKREYNIKFEVEEIINQFHSLLKIRYEQDIKPFYGVTNLLKRLKMSNYNLIIVSASNREVLIPCFKKYDLFKYFDAFFLEDEIGITKSDNSFFKELIKKYNLKLDNLILIDDNNHALESAHSLSIKTIGITNGKNPNSFKKFCNLVVNNIGEINEESINNCW